MSEKNYIRPQAAELIKRLKESRRFIQVVSGARQVGKTRLVSQVAEQSKRELPYRFASADALKLQGNEWIEARWENARWLAAQHKSALLVLDEVQKIPGWDETVKRLWDEDTRNKVELKVVLLGSSPLLVAKGLTESLAGRFEVLRLPHWSFVEMQQAFGWSLDQYLFYGGYPGAASFIKDPSRWANYVKDSLIETTVSRDVLLLSRVNKPALLRRLFELGCAYSGQILSYTKMQGYLQDPGNTTTLAYYLELLSEAGMLAGIPKYTSNVVQRRSSIPKLQVFNNALMACQSNMTHSEAYENHRFWGRLAESAVGSYLINASLSGAFRLFYWREGNYEVDFVLCRGEKLVAIEVKHTSRSAPGLERFAKSFKPTRKLIVGSGGLPLEDFLSTPVEHWLT